MTNKVTDKELDKLANILKRKPLIDILHELKKVYAFHSYDKPGRILHCIEHIQTHEYAPEEFGKALTTAGIDASLPEDLREALMLDNPESETWAEALSKKGVIDAVKIGKKKK